MSRYNPNQRQPRNEQGSVTMEYVIVSTFAALLSVAAITFVGRLAKSKVEVMAEKIGMTPEEFDFDLDLDTDPSDP